MQRLCKNKLAVDLQILYNKASAEYKLVTNKKWNAKYQLVHPNTQLSNAIESVIRTFKAHFISILAGVAPKFSKAFVGPLTPSN